MKISELKPKSIEELNRMFKAGQEKLRLLKFDLASRKLKNAHEIGNLKKDNARILTEISIKKAEKIN